MKILVIGDVMVDEYRYGEVTRMSPEAPVPVLHFQRQERKCGGASNLAMNLKALGADVVVAGVVGKDEPGQWLEDELNYNGIHTLFCQEETSTIIKRRFMAGGKQILREDVEELDTSGWADEFRTETWGNYLLSNYVDAVIFSDYAKGVLHGRVIQAIKEAAWKQGAKIYVDPKPKNIQSYWGCDYIKLNVNDFISIYPDFHSGGVVDFMKHLQEELHETGVRYGIYNSDVYPEYSHLICTRADRDCIYLGNEVLMETTKKVDVVDVTGAGDVFLSVFAVQMLNYTSVNRALRLANEAATESCKFRGTWVVPKDSKYSIKKG